MTGFIVIVLFVTVPFALMYVFYWIRGRLLKRAAIAEVHPRLGQPFDIRFGAAAGKRYRLLMILEIVYEDAEDYYGIFADYTLEISRSTVVRESAGAGRKLPAGVREITDHTFTDMTAVGGRTRYRCTLALARTEPCAAGDEVVVTGTVHAVEGTQVKGLSILVTR